jgi:ubiquinone/menaquinone biosynthesis C-methylase UbiE
MNGEECMLKIYDHCAANLSTLEIWPDFYKIRFEEFKRFKKLFPQDHFNKVLEIGCGIGYQSAFLSCISDKVIASDIDAGNMLKHSRGLDITRNFLKNIPSENIEIVNADAEDLPFEDESFDFIYCSFSFQYIPHKTKALFEIKRTKALFEIKRVLKKDGCFFCVLPTTAYGLANAKKYYLSALKKIITPAQKISNIISRVQHESYSIKKRRSRLLPPPDDESNNFFTELLAYSALRWRKLFKKNGHTILLEKRYSTSIIFMTKK